MRQLPEILGLIETFASRHPFPSQPANLYEPCSYILELGGKRLRPAVVLMANELFAEAGEAALHAAWAVELFHNFSLMHDDIMDAAPLRRGKPTVHEKWSNTSAILSGDVMLIYAYRFLMQCGQPEKVTRLIDIFNRVATEVCEGQQMDLNFETADNVSIPEYIRMIELKTAVLLGGAMEMGAVCADAPAEDTRHLYELGRLAGIAFQIQDDLLDTYGDPLKFGKQVGGDILQNKKTLLVLKTLETAPAADREALLGWMRTGAEAGMEKVEAVRAIFNRNNIPALIAGEQQHYQQTAFAHLDAIGVPDERKTILRTVLEDLFVREK